jgi:3-oxoacyl-[acyl-carrier protein] reductase
MLMSVERNLPGNAVYPELAGHRVLVAGLDARTGVDLARAFADHKARLVLQTPAMTPEIAALGAVLAEAAAEIKLFDTPLADRELAKRFAQGPAQSLGGLDAVFNFVAFSHTELGGCDSDAAIDRLLCNKLAPALLITQVAANRMRLTLGEGLVLNIVRMPAPRHDADRALAGLVRAALAAMTRIEASKWAGEAIRINAVAPATELPGTHSSTAALSSEPDIAALALYLASKKGRQLSGHVFDATGVAGRGC